MILLLEIKQPPAFSAIGNKGDSDNRSLPPLPKSNYEGGEVIPKKEYSRIVGTGLRDVRKLNKRARIEKVTRNGNSITAYYCERGGNTIHTLTYWEKPSESLE